MAEEVTLNGSTVKIRHPFAPIALSIITLGIYGLYWYWAVNKELQVAGQKVEPIVSLLAITFGGLLIVPPFVSLYNTADRIRRSQQHLGATTEISPVLALVMVFIPIVNLFVSVYLQSNLNSAWSAPRPPADQRRSIGDGLEEDLGSDRHEAHREQGAQAASVPGRARGPHRFAGGQLGEHVAAAGPDPPADRSAPR